MRPRNIELEAENICLRIQLEENKKHLASAEQQLETSSAAVRVLKVLVETLTKANESLSKQVKEYTTLIKDLKQELKKMDLNRRTLHKEMQDKKGNIRLFCRVRPHLQEESHKLLCCINYMEEKSLEIIKSIKSIEPTGRPSINRFEVSYDKVFSRYATQEDVLVELPQLVRSALDGYVYVFAYEQTGSGKTYTMDGANSGESLGMISLAVDFSISKTLMLVNIVAFEECYNIGKFFISTFRCR